MEIRTEINETEQRKTEEKKIGLFTKILARLTEGVIKE